MSAAERPQWKVIALPTLLPDGVIPFERFDQEEVQDVCTVCGDFFFNPVSICSGRCKSLYCISCATSVLNKSNATCPTCRSTANCYHPVQLPGDVYAAPVRCNYVGCDESFPASMIHEHEKECPYRIVQCTGCSQLFPANEQKHHEDVCSQRYELCSRICGCWVSYDRIKEHDCSEELLRAKLLKSAIESKTAMDDESVCMKYVELSEMGGCIGPNNEPMSRKDCLLLALPYPFYPKLWFMIAMAAEDPIDSFNMNPSIFLGSEFTLVHLKNLMVKNGGIELKPVIEMITKWIQVDLENIASHPHSGVYSRLRCLLLAAAIGCATGKYVLQVWLEMAKMVRLFPSL